MFAERVYAQTHISVCPCTSTGETQYVRHEIVANLYMWGVDPLNMYTGLVILVSTPSTGMFANKN